MASRTAIAMVDTDNMLKYFGEKLHAVLEDFKENAVWLKEIQEEAKKMFISDFNAEPELMPKTPSERKRHRRRPSVAQDKRFSRSRKNLRRSSIQQAKLKSRIFEEDNSGCNKIVEPSHPVRLTRSTARAVATANLETEKNSESPIVPVNGRVPLVVLSLNDCKSVELHQKGQVANLAQTLLISEDVKLSQKAFEAKPPPSSGSLLETLTPAAIAVIPRSPNRAATKMKIAEAVAAKGNGVDRESGLAGQQLSNVLGAPAVRENASSEDENQTVHRAIRKSARNTRASRRSNCARLVNKYSLNVQRTAVVRESMRKSLRKSSVRRKSVLESSASSHQNCTDKMEGIGERECVEAISNVLLELEQPKEEKQPATLVPENQERRCTRNATKIAILNLDQEMAAAVSKPQARRSSRIQRKDSSDSDKPLSPDSQSAGRKRSYKYAVANVCKYSEVLEKDDSPPKKTPSPHFRTSKVVRPKHKSFLHAVQKNQLLMTPMSVSRTAVKSFIKRNTPLKVDPKEQEKTRLANLKKKREQEEERIQKVEEEKKRKVEEFKKKREMQVKRVLETRSRVQQQEEEKKKKIEQKFAHIDEKNAKEEEECKRQELLQRKKEEELERQRKMAEARKLQEQRQAELERVRQRELQLAADRERERKREQESIQAEKERERLEKERALQLQRELERTARVDAALQAQREKEKLRKEAQEKERKQEEQRLAELERQRLEKERTRKEQERLEHERQENEKRLREDEERKWKEEQDRKAEKEVTSKNILNVTVEVHHSPAPESYAMTPKLKLPKVNLDNYGMDLNSDDSTDDEGAPRKPIPAWAGGKELQQMLTKQYYHPLDLDKFFGVIQPPNLETIFGKSKARYLKRTSSAVWHSPPQSNSIKNVPYGFLKY
uniref:inner centromere protein A-like isoform X2 n=1 Tax=Pristiophorus japonicus TaxID=55135 RepID=UPI00398F5626